MTEADGVRLVQRETVRTARYALAGAPLTSARRIWFALHGYGQLASRFLRPFLGAIPDDTCVVAPEGLSRFYLDPPKAEGAGLRRVGATWMTRESRDSDIRDVLRWLDGVHGDVLREATADGGGAPSVGVLGFSQGVASAMRWVCAGDVRPRMFVAWAGGLATDVQEERMRERLAGVRVAVAAGTRDPIVTEASRRATLDGLRALHPQVAEHAFDGEHALHAPLLARLLDELPHTTGVP